MRPGRDCKYHFLISDIQVYFTALRAAVWRYLIRSGKFVVWPTLFTFLVGSTWRFCFRVCWLCRGWRQSQVWWSLHNLRVLFTLLTILTVFSLNINLHPASHIFTIDMRGLCERPGSKCFSLPLAKSWGNARVKEFFMVARWRILMKQKLCDPVCVHFLGGHLSWCMC